MTGLADEVQEAVRRARSAGTDLQGIEIKKALGGRPKSLPESISALANGDGGLLILGLDEADGFRPVGIDAKAMAVALGNACADLVEPAIRGVVDIVEVDGVPVAACAVPGLDSSRKPCFVKTQGLERGSYIRGHDGDRHLTTYEIHALISMRGQPKDDLVVVPEAKVSDLNPELVGRLLDRLRRTRGPVFSERDDDTVLRMVGALGQDSGHPTVAGLLALGVYPQQFFPQLDVTFVQFPTLDARPLADGTRFLDNQSIDGPIPAMVDMAVSVVTRNMTRGAVISGSGRQDIWEYPRTAVRELIVNAVMHRDYHPMAQGTQIRVEMYPDRLAVTSPGGLFGVVDPDALMRTPITSSRNNTLGKLLEDVNLPGSSETVAENRGSGLISVSTALSDAGMPPARIKSALSHFTVELYRRQGSELGHTASLPSTASSAGPRLTSRQAEVLKLLESDGRASAELAETMHISRQAVLKHLSALEDMGLVRPDANRKSKGVRWHSIKTAR
ncbi:MAG: putative DNA binding domain-containing protein [Propionibacteriaceae bacterium]|jgi:ATP-dependent DNA helicase RecG|nr:putative DNA binding domain-containing protein [Propionibacteriaceae bacterium]